MRLDGRVVVVTGAGRGLGAEYARFLASEGARVVVNDLGVAKDGSAVDAGPAHELAAEIRDSGGDALVNTDDVADFGGARRLITQTIEVFGDLDAVVNNAGILRDRMLVNMDEADWDAVVAVHLKGHFCVTRHASAYWRSAVKESGEVRDRALICTTSYNGLMGSIGQINYATAKAGIAMFARLCHAELNERYGVRAYAIAPGARTRLTIGAPGVGDMVAGPDDGGFDEYDPANVAPFVGWLIAADCPAPSGSVYHVFGDQVTRYEPWRPGPRIETGRVPWTLESLDAAAADLVDVP